MRSSPHGAGKEAEPAAMWAAALLPAWLGGYPRLALWEQGLSDTFQIHLRAKRDSAHRLIRLAQLFSLVLSKSPKAINGSKQIKVLVLVRFVLSQ